LSLNAAVAGSCVGFGREPTTVTGAGLVTPFEPQPASTTAAAHEHTMRTTLRTRRDFTLREYHRKHEAQVLRQGFRTHDPDHRHERPARPALRPVRRRAVQ